MRLLRSAVVAALAFLLLGSFVASGAHLTVTGPILQSFSFEVDPPPPPPPPADETDLYVDVQLYAGKSGKLKATTRVGPFAVPAGGQFLVGYDGQGRACPGEASATGIGGPFPVTGGDHTICVQHVGANGRTVTVRVGDDEQARTVVVPDTEVAGSIEPPADDHDATVTSEPTAPATIQQRPDLHGQDAS